MKPHLRQLAFHADLGLLMAVSIAWALSYTLGYTGVFIRHNRALALDTCRGEVSFWTAAVLIPDRNPSAGYQQMIYDRNSAAITQEWFDATRADKWGTFGAGFGFVKAAELVEPVGDQIPKGKYAYGLVIPYWFLCAAFAAWPLARIRSERRAQRAQTRRLQGLCPRCGYDLRATPDRCPECGAVSGPSDHSP